MITVQLFASYAEALGGQTLKIPLDSGSTVADLVRGIRSLPGGQLLPSSLRIAVNRKFAEPDQIIDGKDEIELGYGLMPEYASMLDADDRWAVVAYVGALQLSQAAPVAELSPADRAALAKGAP